jgi:hypothetical protein
LNGIRHFLLPTALLLGILAFVVAFSPGLKPTNDSPVVSTVAETFGFALAATNPAAPINDATSAIMEARQQTLSVVDNAGTSLIPVSSAVQLLWYRDSGLFLIDIGGNVIDGGSVPISSIAEISDAGLSYMHRTLANIRPDALTAATANLDATVLFACVLAAVGAALIMMMRVNTTGAYSPMSSNGKRSGGVLASARSLGTAGSLIASAIFHGLGAAIMESMTVREVSYGRLATNPLRG